MFKNPLFYGISTFVFCLIIFGLVLPSATCMDGWVSTSIGSQGACSHHGGVNTMPNITAMAISSVAGFFVWLKAKKNQDTLSDLGNEKIEVVEKYSKNILSIINLCLCMTWNAFVRFLKAIQILKFIPENGWMLVVFIMFISIILPPLCFILYPIGIAAILNNADPKNDFLIKRK
ncbi:MAG: hypothetical protein H6867_03500 [Rhodospirillales bacterium]|nr:hypothetical protein [Rhodospirillales bacterium]MCB9996217.1 hypothetical protein [Rhodospirillales bacterium]